MSQNKVNVSTSYCHLRKNPSLLHSQRARLNFRPHLLSSPVQVFIKRRKYALKIAVYALKVSLNILIMQDRAIKTRRDHPIHLPLASALTFSCSFMSQPPTTFPKARSHTHPQPSVTAEAKHIRVTAWSVCVCVCGPWGYCIQPNISFTFINLVTLCCSH